MRSGSRPRRKAPVAAPGLSQSPEVGLPEVRPPEVRPPEVRPPEVRPPEDESAAQGGEEVVESLVRGPIEPPRRGPIEPPRRGPIEPSNAAAEAESVETRDVAAMPEAVGRIAPGTAPTGETPTGVSDPGNGVFVVPAELTEPTQAGAAAEAGLKPGRAAAAAVAAATEIRFARLHLRTGSLLQARSEYEALAGNNLLDVPATLDLAEVRWRTGDLTGAGSAASAYLAADGEESLGFLIAAEAAAAQDHVAEARRHAGRALERSVADLEVFFAGVPRRMTWPESAWTALAAIEIDASSAATPDRAAPTIVAGPAPEAPEGSLWARTGESPAPESPQSEATAIVAAELSAPESESESQLPAPEPPPLDREVATGTAALQGGDALMAALHFAVALRVTPESARAVVDAIGERRDLALELVRGDALRLLGNESDAGEAYASVASALGKPRAASTEPAAPQPAKTPEVGEPPAIRWE